MAKYRVKVPPVGEVLIEADLKQVERGIWFIVQIQPNGSRQPFWVSIIDYSLQDAENAVYENFGDDAAILAQVVAGSDGQWAEALPTEAQSRLSAPEDSVEIAGIWFSNM